MRWLQWLFKPRRNLPFDQVVKWNGRCPDCNGNAFEGYALGGPIPHVATCSNCRTRLHVVLYHGVLLAKRNGSIEKADNK